MAKKLIDMLMKVPAIELKPLFSKLMGVKRAYIVALLVVIAVPAIFLTYGFVHMIGTSKVYCLNCHVNQRNMGFWKASTVHPSVSCNSCHDVDNKGAMSAALHFSFSAKGDVVSSHCVGCHKNDLDRGVGFDAKVRTRPVNELIRIPHAMHIKDLGIKCTYCHSNIYHERRPGKYATYRPAMGTCYTCHDQEKMACNSCHPEGLPSAQPISGKVGGGMLIYNPTGAGEVVFSHKSHAVKGFKCNDCHGGVFNMRHTDGVMTMTRMYGGKDCGHCHNGKVAFASTQCGSCHRGGAASGGGTVEFSGGGYGKVAFSHQAHIASGLKCQDCHVAIFNYKKTGGMTMSAMDKGQYCGACHDGKKAFASEQCGKCHQGAKKDGGTIAYEGGGTGKVTFSHDNHIAMGLKCRECHAKLFGYRKTSGKMTMAGMNQGLFCGGCHNGKRAFAADDCGKCHAMN
jgi:c(7)-type cytochrome triheme protein